MINRIVPRHECDEEGHGTIVRMLGTMVELGARWMFLVGPDVG